MPKPNSLNSCKLPCNAKKSLSPATINQFSNSVKYPPHPKEDKEAAPKDKSKLRPTLTHPLKFLPLHHRDPFDRLLIAQAIAEEVPIISIDKKFDLYGVNRQW